jgi:hypothetical protein
MGATVQRYGTHRGCYFSEPLLPGAYGSSLSFRGRPIAAAPYFFHPAGNLLLF